MFLLLAALVLDWYFGEPDILWSKIPHPVVLFGKAVSWADKRYNLETDSRGAKYRKGSIAIALLIGAALVTGWVLDWVAQWLGPFGWLLELFLVFSLIFRIFEQR